LSPKAVVGWLRELGLVEHRDEGWSSPLLLTQVDHVLVVTRSTTPSTRST
jgi:hypothetical protein